MHPRFRLLTPLFFLIAACATPGAARAQAPIPAPEPPAQTPADPTAADARLQQILGSGGFKPGTGAKLPPITLLAKMIAGTRAVIVLGIDKDSTTLSEGGTVLLGGEFSGISLVIEEISAASVVLRVKPLDQVIRLN